MPLEPFPLSASSWHHSGYHRFLLGADPSVLAPLPKPYCIGALAELFPDLTKALDLPRWRKLYHASFPWVTGFGERHYRLGNVPPHHPLPAEYRRPARKYAAFDFVQIADPSVSALALVAGDQRIISRFTALADTVSLRIEKNICPKGDSRSPTRQMLAAQFVEPNNRWLMPLLHVHSRVLNLTSSGPSGYSLSEIGMGALRNAGDLEPRNFLDQQSEMLSSLGYRPAIAAETHLGLRVEGVSPKILAAMEAPNLAVLGLIRRMLSSSRSDSAFDEISRESPGVIASLTEQLECFLSKAVANHRPAKFGVPSEGPWRNAVRQQLSSCCPAALDLLDKETRRARAIPVGPALFPNPSADEGHFHPVNYGPNNPGQSPMDPELLGSPVDSPQASQVPSRQLLGLYLCELDSIRERIVRAPMNDCLCALRRPLSILREGVPNPSETEEAMHLFRDLVGGRSQQTVRGSKRHELAPRFAERTVPSIDEMINAFGGKGRSRDHEGISRSL